MLVKLKWYGIDQNNSGGYIIENDFVGSDIFIQAASPEEAEQKALEIVSDYSEYCECCGERWYINLDESDGNDEPCKYDEPLRVEYRPYGKYAVLHHYDGKVTKVYGDKRHYVPCRRCGSTHENPSSSSLCCKCGSIERLENIERQAEIEEMQRARKYSYKEYVNESILSKLGEPSPYVDYDSDYQNITLDGTFTVEDLQIIINEIKDK